MGNKKLTNGFTLIEILVVIGIFSVLAIISTQAVLLSLSGARKASASVGVRENLETAMATMERHIRGAKSINTACPGTYTTLSYRDATGTTTSFSCDSVPYIASNSAQLTSPNITITSCRFTCYSAVGTTPASVDISVTARSNVGGLSLNEQSLVTMQSKVFLRAY